MPFLYYCKNGGTAGNPSSDGGRVDASTPRTGSWNASPGDYYAHPQDAVSNAATPPTVGDTIVWSRASSEQIAVNTSFTTPDGVHIVTVDDNNQDTYSRAISHQIDSFTNTRYEIKTPINAAMPSLFCGWSILSGRNWTMGMGGSNVWFHECRLEHSSNDVWDWRGARGDEFLWYDLDFSETVSNGSYIYTENATSAVLIGGTLSNLAPYAFRVLSAGTYIQVIGTDLSGCDSGTAIVHFSNASDATSEVSFYRCKLPTSWTVNNVNIATNYRVVVASCDSEYQYEVFCRQGEIEFKTTHFHADDDTLDDGSSKGAYEFVTDAVNCDRTAPLWLGSNKQPRWLMAENNEAATKTKARIKFASASTLDDNDVAIYLLYPNGTTTYQLETAYHFPQPLKSGTALSTESGKWTGAGTTNQYYIDIPMTSPGNGICMAYVGVTKTNATVYFSPQIDFVA